MNTILALLLHLAFNNGLQIKTISPLAYDLNPADVLYSTFDGDQRMYFTSISDAKIFVCDIQGNILPTIGKKSEGPDGFLLPMAVKVHKGHLYVYDRMKRKIFQIDPDQHTFLKDWSVKPINNFEVRGDQVFLALSQAQKGYVFGKAKLGKEVTYLEYFHKDPGFLRVQGTKSAGLLIDDQATLWVSYTGDYNVSQYDLKGSFSKRITKEPLDFNPPRNLSADKRFDRTARMQHYRSFDKISGIYQCGELIVLFRFKDMEHRSLDIYQKNGTPHRLSLQIPFLIPVGAHGEDMLALQMTNDVHDDRTDMNLVKVVLP